SNRAWSTRWRSPGSRSTASSTSLTPERCSSGSSRSKSGPGATRAARRSWRRSTRSSSRFRMELEDRAGLGQETLYQAAQALSAKANQTGQFAGVYTSYQINVPQLFADVDRDRVKQQGVELSDVFQTLQIYLGSEYVNDFNRFGRTYQVMAQADAPYRATAEDIAQLKVKNAHGDMVPLGSLINVKQSFGPDQVMHYNAYPSADINGGPAPGVSSGQAVETMERLA